MHGGVTAFDSGQTRLLTPQPLYYQVRQVLMEHIRKGEWCAGETLPNEGFLAKRFGVSVGTIRKAIEGLEINGVVKRVQGRGTFVASFDKNLLAAKFSRLRKDDGAPLNLSFELLGVASQAASAEIAAELEIEPGSEIFQVSQLLKSEGRSIGFETSSISARGLPNFARQMTFGQEVYRVLADYGMLVTQARDRISYGTADGEAAKALAVTNGQAIMRVVRQALCLDRSVAEFRIGLYRADGLCYAAEIA